MVLRSLIIGMSVLCIGLGPALQELPKIPAVWGHYQHHIQDHGENDLSFVQFLKDHFTGTGHSEDEHGTLPLHSVWGFAGASGVAYVGVDAVTSVEPYFTEPSLETYTPSSAQPSSQTSSEIWTPPRS